MQPRKHFIRYPNDCGLRSTARRLPLCHRAMSRYRDGVRRSDDSEPPDSHQNRYPTRSGFIPPNSSGSDDVINDNLLPTNQATDPLRFIAIALASRPVIASTSSLGSRDTVHLILDRRFIARDRSA